MARNLYTKEELNNIIKDYTNGMTDQEVADKYNRSIYGIRIKLKDAGVFRYITNRWSKNEIDILKKNYSTTPWDKLMNLLPGKNKESIITKACELGVKREPHYWTEKDLDILRKGYENKKRTKEIYEELNGKYSESAIKAKANKMGLKKREWWSEEEVQILKENYSKLYIDEICKLLPKRNRINIIDMAAKLNLTSKYTKEKAFSTDEKEFIRISYKYMTDKEIGQVIHRTWRTVQAQRLSMGLIKGEPNSEYLHNRHRLAKYIRDHNYEWRARSIESCDGKCIITGKPFQVVHHIISFGRILEEVLMNLHLEDESFENYSEAEMIPIAEKFFEVQDSYPLGACLTRKIHLKFHNLYGYYYNTEDQFEEFIQKIKSKAILIV